MPKIEKEEPIKIQRPYPLLATFSSPASLQTTKTTPSTTKRQRKVSFNEKVVVVCTVFDEEDEDDYDVPAIRRHSTGETNLKSILIYERQQPFLTQKITTTLKQFKNRLLFVN